MSMDKSFIKKFIKSYKKQLSNFLLKFNKS